jgi:hypothetical protein
MPVVLDGPPMIQEYIPGKEKQQFYLLLDRDGRLKMAFCPKTHRLFDRLYRNSSAMSESSLPHTSSAHAASVAEKLGWWGGITMQTKIDPRDGLPKLLEMNPRLGHHLWYVTSLGINTPLMCLKIARREKVEPIEHYPVGKMFLSPVEDVLGFGCCVVDTLTYTMRTRLMRTDSLDALAAPLPIKEMLRSYGRTYFNGKEKIFDPYFTYFLQDPGVSILWWLKFSWQVLATTKHLGR